MQQTMKNAWFSNVRKDILAGMTVAFALIPEAIAFSIMAGVDPMVGLYASFIIAISISIFGGRPGMISAATGAMASLMGPLVAKYGIEYLFAATALTGVIQWIFGALKFGRFITFVPHSVITGFVNALAIIIFMAQLPNFKGQSWPMYTVVAATLAIVYVLPRFTKAVPSALVAIILMTIVTVSFHIDIPTVGDMGKITGTLPSFHIADVPFNLTTLLHLLPYSLALAVVGMTETLLTSTIVDEMTETKSDKNKEVRGQGIANLITSFFGGMAGCAMIGQTVINVKSGGRTRLSTFTAGTFLLFLLLVLGNVVQNVPMAALVGVMFMVSFGTFQWGSIRTLAKIPRSDAIVMVMTVAIVVATSDLAIGVVCGVIMSAVVFGWKMSRIHTETTILEDGTKIYHVSGQLFFGTMSHFVDLFQVSGDPQSIVIDFGKSHVWDHSAIAAIEKVVEKYTINRKTVTLIGLNEESQALLSRTGFDHQASRREDISEQHSA